MKYLIWGTGRRCKKYLIDQATGFFKEHEVVAFVDNNIKKYGEKFWGKSIISPNEIKKYSYDKFLSEVSYSEQTKRAVLNNVNCSECDSSQLYQGAVV